MVEFGAVCHLCHGNCKIRIGNTQKIGDGMTIFNFISLFGGLALFLYGMQLMGDGLKKGSSGALKAPMDWCSVSTPAPTRPEVSTMVAVEL